MQIAIVSAVSRAHSERKLEYMTEKGILKGSGLGIEQRNENIQSLHLSLFRCNGENECSEQQR